MCAGLQFLSASQRHPSQSCLHSVRGAAQECIDHYGTSGFLASGLDENNDGASLTRPFTELRLARATGGCRIAQHGKRGVFTWARAMAVFYKN